MQALGVHSEVGKLRTVMVCRPGLAHQRLTPGNAAELLFACWSLHKAARYGGVMEGSIYLEFQKAGVRVCFDEAP